MQCQYKTQKQTKLCRFFLVSGNGPAILCMSGIKLINILRITCNTTEARWQAT